VKTNRRGGHIGFTLAFVVAIVVFVPRPAFAETPDITCNLVNEGARWDDNVVVWECQCQEVGGYLICEWVPIGVIIWDKKQVYNNSTYGRVRLTTAFDGNPHYGATMTHSRNPNGSTRYQGTGELRARVVFEKWNGSSWVTCVNSGYTYSTGPYSEWKRSHNMHQSAECGSGTYRVRSYGHMYDAGQWRGGNYVTVGCYRD